MPFFNRIDRSPNSVEVLINGNLLKCVITTKYLGLIIDSNMKWKNHIKKTVSRTRYLLFIFYKLSKILETEPLLKIYYGLFDSIAKYGIIAWGSAYKNALKPLKNL